jgi:dTMP kinase
LHTFAGANASLIYHMKFIVTEGLDGSGKSTQIKHLKNYLQSKNIPYRYLHFPRTDTPIYGDLIARFLRGEFGPIHAVDPYLVALLYAGDREEAKSMISEWLNEKYLVIADRYVYSNIAFQCAKLNEQAKKETLKDWILDLEFSYHKIPKPDLVLYLDVPFEFTKQNLSGSRTGNDREYLKGTRDIHENDIPFQERVRQMYLWQAQDNELFRVINCHSPSGNILQPDHIFHLIKIVLETENIIPSV